jgi:tRNA(Ile)-lysidine synthase
MIKNRFIGLKQKKKLYIVAVSGGPDSMFLLERMRLLNYTFVVCHVNYKKRDDSDYDESVVFDYCKKFNIKFFLYCPSYLENKENFQSSARNERYKFFFQIADEFSVNGIVIAHNFEDLLETYVMQRERKSLVDYWGLKSVTTRSKYIIFRPILNFTKKEILSYLEKNGIKYAIDKSNYSLIYRRNVVRKDIFLLSDSNKENIYNEINKRNLDLKIIISEFQRKSNLLVNFNLLKLNDEWLKSSFEIQIRIIFLWVNSFSKNEFIQRKKNILMEIRKQLLSKKGKININLGSDFIIRKTNNLAFISDKTYEK